MIITNTNTAIIGIANQQQSHKSISLTIFIFQMQRCEKASGSDAQLSHFVSPHEQNLEGWLKISDPERTDFIKYSDLKVGVTFCSVSIRW